VFYKSHAESFNVLELQYSSVAVYLVYLHVLRCIQYTYLLQQNYMAPKAVTIRGLIVNFKITFIRLLLYGVF